MAVFPVKWRAGVGAGWNIQLPDVGSAVGTGKCGAVKNPPVFGGRVEIF